MTLYKEQDVFLFHLKVNQEAPVLLKKFFTCIAERPSKYLALFLSLKENIRSLAKAFRSKFVSLIYFKLRILLFLGQLGL